MSVVKCISCERARSLVDDLCDNCTLKRYGTLLPRHMIAYGGRSSGKGLRIAMAEVRERINMGQFLADAQNLMNSADLPKENRAVYDPVLDKIVHQR